MPKKQKPQFGELPPKYNFVLNPYPSERLSRCPFCGGKTGQRKRPLLIHVDPKHLIALNYTCRYCQQCDLLIAHKDEIEHLLSTLFSQYDPKAIGNEYLIIGTVEKKCWREGLEKPKDISEMLPHASDFKAHYQELRLRQTGWYPKDQEPPIKDPPPSQEWVKGTSRNNVQES
jgi:YgiT-type zinc finger domain-containing protein